MGTRDDSEDLRKELGSLTNDELLNRLGDAVRAADSQPKDRRKQTLSEYLNEQEATEKADNEAADGEADSGQ